MELNFKTYGQGEPVVILHGLFGMLDNWLSIGKQLARDYSVYLVDLRNHGKSPHSDDHSYALMAADVVAFLEAHWLHQTTIVGHSMGGKVAMHLALEYQDIVENLVVVDIAPRAYPPHHQDVIEAMQSFDPAEAENRRDILLHLQGQLHNAGLVAFLMKNLKREKEGGFRWKMNLPALIANYHEVNTPITSDDVCEAKTLFVRGDRSDYISDDDWPEILDLFPFAQLETIPDAGHWVHADQPDAMLGALRKFLDH